MKGEKSVLSDSGSDPDVEEQQHHADGQNFLADGSCACCGQRRICNKQLLRSESIAGVTATPDGPAGCDKASFRLIWGSVSEKSKQHKHDVVSFGSGNITAAVRSSKQITLVWESPPRSIFILCKPESSTVESMCKEMTKDGSALPVVALRACRWLKEEKGIALYVEPRLRKQLVAESSFYSFLQTWEEDEDVQELYKKVDLVVTLGGDGTMLWAATMFKGPIPPVVAFSMGSLGFMTPFSSDRYKDYLQTIMTGPVYITLRHRLHCQIVRNGEDENGSQRKPATEDHLVLNEVVVDRGMSSFLTNLEVYCDDVFVTHVQGDGLILSTPSGSTAYSLAAGGSMVHPEVPGILFTPICPHSLSFRPLILPEYVTLRVQVPASSRGQPWASFDGKDRRQLTPGDALIVSMSVWPVPAVCDQECTNDFFRSVREGLHWNLRKSQSADGPEDQACSD